MRLFGSLITVFVNGKALFLCEFFGNFNGETESVVQTESRFAGEYVPFNKVDNLVKFFKTVGKSFRELCFFFFEFVVNFLLVVFKFGVNVRILVYVALCNFFKTAFG